MYVKVAARCYAAMLPPGGGGVHILWQTRQQLLSSDRTCPGAGGDKSVPIRRTRDHCLLSPPDYWWHPLITTLAALWLSWQFWRVKEIKLWVYTNNLVHNNCEHWGMRCPFYQDCEQQFLSRKVFFLIVSVDGTESNRQALIHFH